MSIRAIAWAWEQDLPAMTKMVLLALADHHNDETGQCNPTVKRIAAKAGIKERTVERHMKTLSDHGLVAVKEDNRTDGSRTSNMYYLSLGGDFKTPGGDQDTPGGVSEGGTGTGIEPELKSNDAPEPSSAIAPEGSAPKGAKKRVREIDEEFIASMHERFDVVFGPDGVNERIEEAVAHKAISKYTDKQAYVRGWLRRDAEKMPARASPPRASPNGRANRVERDFSDLERYNH